MKPLHLGFDAVEQPINLEPSDRLTHMHVIGSSGSGKSKFLEWVMRGDLNNRQGFCLLDPHGSLYQAIVNYTAHHVVDREIILLNPSEQDAIINFSPFRKADGGDISVQVSNRLNAILHAWGVDNSDATPTLERTLRLIFTVMLEHNLSLPQAEHLIDFNSDNVRGPLVEQLQTPLIQKEWRELQSLKVADWRNEILAAKNRLFRLLTSTAITRFMGLSERSIDVFEIMEQGKILLVNLAQTKKFSHENARVFGSLLINEFFECALRRQKRANGDDPTPYYLYMDEFASFISPSIADMLDEVRKFGLFLVMAHQRFGQINEDVIDAVLTNCKIKAVFGGLRYDSAKLMAQELFIGELDPMKIKAAIYQTKFWPQYARDKVYSQTSGYSESSGISSSSMSGFSSGLTAGETFTPGNWFNSPTQVGLSSVESSGFSYASGSSKARASGYSESQGMADIPIFVPVPFNELSSVQYYTPEEQLIELIAALKEQYGRHCFIKIHNQKTQPMLVPFVQDYYTTKENKQWYVSRQFSKQNALPVEEVDKLLELQESALINTDTPPRAAKEPISESNKKKSKTKPRTNLFSDLDISPNDPIGRE